MELEVGILEKGRFTALFLEPPLLTSRPRPAPKASEASWGRGREGEAKESTRRRDAVERK